VVRIIVRQQFPEYIYLLDEGRVASQTASFLDSSSYGEIVGVGRLAGEASGLFMWYRFTVTVDGQASHVFRKNFWGRLYDRSYDITLWRGEIQVSGKIVGQFTRARENLIKPMFQLDLDDRRYLPVAVAYLPFAIANRHL
jgi:hypothetical protein